MEWSETLRWMFVWTGWLVSLHFLVTFVPRAIRSGTLGGWQLFDLCGWIFGGWLVLSGALVVLVFDPVPMGGPWWNMLSRLGLYAYLDLVILTRSVRWWDLLRQERFVADERRYGG